MSISDYLKNILLDLAFGGTPWPGSHPGFFNFALYTEPPTSAGGGTEVSGGGYARAPLAANGTNFSVSAMVATNLAEIAFAKATTEWGVVTHFGLHDISAEGRLLFWAELGASKNVGLGDTITIPAGKFTHTFGGNMGAALGNQLNEHIFKQTAVPDPNVHYFALANAASPSDAATEQAIGTNGYNRGALANDPGNWLDATGGRKKNGILIGFSQASGPWGAGGPLTHFAIVNHSTNAVSASNCLWFGTLSPARTVTNSDRPGLLPNEIELVLE